MKNLKFCLFLLIFCLPHISQSQILFDSRGGDIHVPPIGSARQRAKVDPKLDEKYKKPVAFNLVQEIFNELKDPMFFENKSIKIPWDYIQDGCHVRSQLARYVLDKYHLESFKVFVFGSLKFSDGKDSAEWNFHVASGVYSDQKVYILDPSVAPYGPLLMDDWIRSIAGNEPTKVSFCSSKTYKDYDHCDHPEEVIHERFLDELESLLFTAKLRQK